LDETLELASQVGILTLKALSMLFKGISFGEEIAIFSAVLLRGDS